MKSVFGRKLIQSAAGIAIAACAHPAFSQEKIKISIAHVAPTTAPTNTGSVGVLKSNLEATGKVEVTMYGTGSAYSVPTKFSELTETGVVDIALGAQQFEAGRYPLNLLAGVPFMVNDHVKASRAYLRALRSTPELMAEFNPIRVLVVAFTSTEQFHARKPLKSIDDLKGMRVMAINPLVLAMIRDVGGNVVALPQPAQYENLQKGVVDAVAAPWSGAVAFRTIELTSSHLEIKSVAAPIYIIMNQKKYDSLPPDLKKIIDDFSTEDSAARIAALWSALDDVGIADAKKRNHSVTPVSDAERAVLRKRFQHLTDARIAELDKKGLPASRIYDALSRAIAAEEARR